MEKVTFAVLMLASCADPPPPASPPGPEPWVLKEIQEREDAERRAKRAEERSVEEKANETKLRARWEVMEEKRRAALAAAPPPPEPEPPAPPPSLPATPPAATGPVWSSGFVLDRDLLQLMAPEERTVWATYGALPRAKRTPQALSDAISETGRMCRSDGECDAHRAMVIACALQGRHAGTIMVRDGEERWVTTGGGAESCRARFGEIQQDELIRKNTTGMWCATVGKSTVTGKTIFRDESFTRWR